MTGRELVTTRPAPEPVSGGTTVGPAAGAGAALLVAVLAALVVALVRRRSTGRRRPPARTGGLAAASAATAAGVGATAVAPVEVIDPDRRVLVEALIDARDRVGDSAVGARLVDALAAVGVEPVDPTGERFDPARHVAAGADRLTGDPTLDGRVAEVMAWGWLDRGRLIRLPRVVVGRARPGLTTPTPAGEGGR